MPAGASARPPCQPGAGAGERGAGSQPGGPLRPLRASPRPGSIGESGERSPPAATTGRSGTVTAAPGGGGCPGVRPVGRRGGFQRAERGKRVQRLPSGLRGAGARSGEPAWPCLRLPAPQRRELRAAKAGIAPLRPPPVSAAAPRLAAVTQPLASAVRAAALPPEPALPKVKLPRKPFFKKKKNIYFLFFPEAFQARSGPPATRGLQNPR